jgi:hypothetical protein
MNALAPIDKSEFQKDPTTLSWPPTLPIELALKTAAPHQIQSEYGYSDEEWAALPKNPAFMKDLAAACEMVKQEGMSFKLKARLIAEENLKQVWKLINDDKDKVPAAVKAKLIEINARWAGFDPKSNGEGNEGGGPSNAFQININLGDGY